jgi:hypothetical protein
MFSVPPAERTAGDLLLEVVDPWVEHASACDRDDCEQCVLLINRLRLAYKVWKNSAHQSASVPPAEHHRCSGCGHRWTGALKGAELCGDCWRSAWNRKSARVPPEPSQEPQ